MDEKDWKNDWVFYDTPLACKSFLRPAGLIPLPRFRIAIAEQSQDGRLRQSFSQFSFSICSTFNNFI
jgi:hypothetical protein